VILGLGEVVERLGGDVNGGVDIPFRTREPRGQITLVPGKLKAYSEIWPGTPLVPGGASFSSLSLV
jgi:hypothetical protein